MKAPSYEAAMQGPGGGGPLDRPHISPPGVFSKTDGKIVETTAKGDLITDGILHQPHALRKTNKLLGARLEVFRIESSMAPFIAACELSHISNSPGKQLGRPGTDKVLDLYRREKEARDEGCGPLPRNQYAYTASSTGISQWFPQKSAFDGGRHNSSETD